MPLVIITCHQPNAGDFVLWRVNKNSILFHPDGRHFKGHLLWKIHFYMGFEHKCVLAVCEQNHPRMIKIHPVFFLQSQ